MRRWLVAVLLSLGLIAMHGGLGATACTMSAGGDTMLMGHTVSSTAGVHHAPAPPNDSGQVVMAHCLAILRLPGSGLAIALSLLALFAMTVLGPALWCQQPAPRGTGREPPRLRLRDPLLRLGALRI